MNRATLRETLSTTTILLAIAIFSSSALAQLNQVDPAFQPVPSTPPVLPSLGGISKGQAIQPDGKVVIWGGKIAVRDQAKGLIARLNPDGSLDNSFSYCSCHFETINNIRVQPDGKILAAGYNGSRAVLIRLNPDGSLDESFSANVQNGSGFSQARLWLVRPDGKIYVQTEGSGGGFNLRAIIRLNPDGSSDTGFAAIGYGGFSSSSSFPSDMVENGGKLYISANTFGPFSTSGEVRRFNLNGTVDNDWARPTFSGSSPNASLVNGIDFETDGSMLVVGRFASINGFTKFNFGRVLPAGNVDLAYSGPSVSEGKSVRVLSSGKALVSLDFAGTILLARLKTDGSPDDTFTFPGTLALANTGFVLDSMERIYFYGADTHFYRLNPNGDIDPSYAPSVSDFGKIYALVRQPDGKVIMAGDFTQLNGEARASIARVNSDGTIDPTFNGGTGFNVPPKRMILQADGKIIAIGSFSDYNGTARSGILRINSDGSIDNSFAPTVQDIATVVLQSDGKILIGGSFTSVNGTAKAFLARLLPDGNLDGTFTTVVGCCDVTGIVIQTDGKIVIAGGFAGVNGFNKPNLARLNANGTLDQTLTANNPSYITKLGIQPSGKFLTASATGADITRRNSDGSEDNTFTTIPVRSGNTAQNPIESIFVDADGSIVVGGKFDGIGSLPHPNLARFSTNGQLDLLFFPKGASDRVRTIVPDAPGKILIGGDFARVADVVRAGVARLNIVAFVRATPFDFDGDGRGDISVYRSSTNRWYEVVSSTGGVVEETFGIAGDIPTPADFDGDGLTDEAVFRPSSGQWWYKSSQTGAQVAAQFGAAGDIPRPSDFDGDGRADFVLFRPSNNTWYRAGTVTQAQTTVFGIAGDQPLVGDFDGDGKSDLAVFRPSTGDWWYAASSAGGAFRQSHWGQNGDIPVPADYDGDGRTDFAIFRPSDGGWYIYNSGNGSFTIMQFGTNGDRPVAADYDGDSRADVAVFRPSTGIWYLFRSTAGFAGYQFGISTDVAIPGSLHP